MARTLALIWILILASAAASAQAAMVADMSDADDSQALALATLQGIINRADSSPTLYLQWHPIDLKWVHLYTRSYDALDAGQALEKLKGRARGQVIYDLKEPFTATIACMVAALRDAIPTDRSLGMTTLVSLRGKWKTRAEAFRWAMQKLLPSCNDRMLAIAGEGALALRDLFAKEKMFVINLNPGQPGERDLIAKALARFKRGAVVLCSPAVAQDMEWQRLISDAGHLAVLCSEVGNLSFHSSFQPTAPLYQHRRYIAPTAKLVCFLYLGGEDVAHALGRMRVLWEDAARGEIPLGWTVSPALLDLAPAIFQRYIVEARASGKDTLVLAPNGYDALPFSFRESQAPGSLERTKSAASAADMKVLAISDPAPLDSISESLANFAQAGAIEGALALGKAAFNAGFVGGAPVVAEAVRASEPHAALEAINELAKTNRLILVGLDPDRMAPSDVAYIASRLTGGFEVVGPWEFVRAAAYQLRYPQTAKGTAAVKVVGFNVSPGQPTSMDNIEVKARIEGAEIPQSVKALYRFPGRAGLPSGALFERDMTRPAEGAYSLALPPMISPGTLSVSVAAFDSLGRKSQDQPVEIEVKAEDSDADGMPDPVETAFRSDPSNPDTDGDGLRDGNDPDPILPGGTEIDYYPALSAPGDAAFIHLDEGSKVNDRGAREIEGAGAFTYAFPLEGIRPIGRTTLQLLLSGDVVASASADGQEYVPLGSVKTRADRQTLKVWPIEERLLGGRSLFVRISDGSPDKAPAAAIYQIRLSADPEGPSIAPAPLSPPNPSPQRPPAASALAYSPDGIEKVELVYEPVGKGQMTIPASEVGRTQTYQAAMVGLEDGDIVCYRFVAADKKGRTCAAPPACFPVGMSRQEFVTLAGSRDFDGRWRDGTEWGRMSRWTSTGGATDTVSTTVQGGFYNLWLLCAPRGRSIQVMADGKIVGSAAPNQPDGWQKIGALTLKDGVRKFDIVCGVSSAGAPASACGYAELLLTTDSNFEPPAPTVLDWMDSITMLEPPAGSTVEGRVPVRLTATGSVSQMRVYLDGQRFQTLLAAPFRFTWNTTKHSEGSHLIQVIGLNKKGREAVTLFAGINIAKAPPRGRKGK